MRNLLFVLSMVCLASLATTPAEAASLVVMATDTTAIAGEKVFTIGVEVTSADLQAPGVGPNPVLSIHNLQIPFSASAGPFQASGVNNNPDLQTIQSVSLDGEFPGPYTGFAATQLYKDSWWYSSFSPIGANGDVPGILDGQIDEDGNTGPITTNPYIGASGYIWQPTGAGVQGGNNATPTMTFSGTYGPSGANALDQGPLLSKFVGGVLTVPLVQVVAIGTIVLPFSFADDQGISVGDNFYTWPGIPFKSRFGTPGWIDYENNTIGGGPLPEPSTGALMVLGAAGPFVARRSRGRPKY